jgi:hypothetical protein
VSWWTNDPVVEDNPQAATGEWWKSDPVIGEEVSDTIPQKASETVVPSNVPAEFQQFAEQQAMEQARQTRPLPDWLTQAIPEATKFAGKVALSAGSAQHGRFYWPTDEEVQTPIVPAKYMPPYMIGEAAERLFPDSDIAKGYGGTMKGVGEFMSGLTSAENLATLPIAGGGKTAVRLISGAFLGQSIVGTPEQWKAFNEADNISDKFRIATTMGLGIAAPVAGAAATFKRAPKIVEPVRTTQEILRSEPPEAVFASETDLRSRSDFPRSLESEIVSEIPRKQPEIPAADNPPQTAAQVQAFQDSPRPEINIPASETARVKTEVDPIRQAAIRFPDGTIFEGATHGDAWARATSSGVEYNPQADIGFITTSGEFLNPADALSRAKKVKQIEQVDYENQRAMHGWKRGEQPTPSEMEAESFNAIRKDSIPEPIGVEAAEIQRRNAPTNPATAPSSAVPIIEPQPTQTRKPAYLASEETVAPPLKQSDISQPEITRKSNAIQENIAGKIPEPIRPDIQRGPSEAVLRDERIQGRTEGEPRPEIVQGTPAAARASKIGKSIEAKAVEAKLTEGFKETALYDPITIREQSEMAAGLVKGNPELTRAIVRGEAPLPERLLGPSLITAVEEHLARKPDAHLTYELANSPLISATSKAAQEMRLMAERTPDSITAAFREIQEARRAGSKQRDETPGRVVESIKKEVVRNASKRPTWEAFVREITC